MLRELKKSGIEVGIFNPKGFNMFKSLTNYRSHKKAVIIDNHTTFYGGSNIGDEYLGMDQKSFN
jgi:cardiolipin synthase